MAFCARIAQCDAEACSKREMFCQIYYRPIRSEVNMTARTHRWVFCQLSNAAPAVHRSRQLYDQLPARINWGSHAVQREAIDDFEQRNAHKTRFEQKWKTHKIWGQLDVMRPIFLLLLFCRHWTMHVRFRFISVTNDDNVSESSLTITGAPDVLFCVFFCYCVLPCNKSLNNRRCADWQTTFFKQCIGHWLTKRSCDLLGKVCRLGWRTSHSSTILVLW